MLDTQFAETFAREWIDAWNARDIHRIMAHYADTIEMRSPMIARVVRGGVDTLRGKATVGRYWEMALEGRPDLRFTLRRVLVAPGSLVIEYESAGVGSVAEYLEFDANGRVHRAAAHYVRDAIRA